MKKVIKPLKTLKGIKNQFKKTDTVLCQRKDNQIKTCGSYPDVIRFFAKNKKNSDE